MKPLTVIHSSPQSYTEADSITYQYCNIAKLSFYIRLKTLLIIKALLNPIQRGGGLLQQIEEF